MTSDLLSKQLRNAFREFLAGWILRDIEMVFEEAGVECDRTFEPTVGGERRAFVEKHYHTLDFTSPGDVRRLLAACGSIIDRAERRMPDAIDPVSQERSVGELKAALLKDGFKYERGAIVAVTPDARVVFEASQSNKISEVTRRAIFDDLTVGAVNWSGRLPESDFLSRLYDLSGIRSGDRRFDSFASEICQHREWNLDWPDDWVFTDRRLNLLHGPDKALLAFLCEMIHPAVRPDTSAAALLVTMLNKHLTADGWEIVEGPSISGKPSFVARRSSSAAVVLPEPQHSIDILSDEYVRELSGKCEGRISSGDLDGAVTVGRTLVEAVLGE